MSRIGTTGKLGREIEALDDLTRDELVERWRRAHGCPPPKGVKRKLLLHSAAWHLQVKRRRGLKGEAKRTLRRLINAGSAAPSECASSPCTDRKVSGAKPVRYLRGRLAPGVRLVREWNGRMHVVEVTGSGFLYDNRTFGSLSAVARRITGTQWSGPRFFGL